MKLIQDSITGSLRRHHGVALWNGQSRIRQEGGQGLHILPSGGKMKELTPAGQYYKDHNHSLEGYKAPAGN